MLVKKSRYNGGRLFEPQGQEGVFRGLRARPVTTLEGVIEHTITDTDRLDHLARHYYDDDRLWWRIIDANPQLLFADKLLGPDYVGRVILIPQGKA
ncbi:hypothetical protein [Cellvibrio sp. NN19]|uniref:hypothetical protein n=1 Tax=Cellvibrio chitinivorans TaxID=3102792 RepID=UPI002B4139BA|nr:hypothetical protein [Cellvibrio sp. NN19]